MTWEYLSRLLGLLVLGAGLLTSHASLTPNRARALETLKTSELRSITAREGLTIGLNMEIGAINTNNQLAISFRDDDGIPSSRGGSSTQGVLQARFSGPGDGTGDTLKISDFGFGNEAQFGINFDSQEGMVIDAIDAQLDGRISAFFVGSAPPLDDANVGQNPNSLGALEFNDISIDDSFLKVKIR